MAPNLGILLADATRVGVAVELVRAIVTLPIDAALFLMDDGVKAAHDPRLRALLDDGCDVSLCAMDAEERGIVAVDGGPRFGSQYDHAVLMRDAQHVIALAGTRIDDHRPSHTEGRTIAVRLTQDARHPRTAQALRSAVGYAACALKVVVLVEPMARGLLAHEDHAANVLRALQALRAADVPIVGAAPHHSPPGLQVDIEVTW